MKLFAYPDKKKWADILQRPSSKNRRIHSSVKEILDNVRKQGDRAVKQYERQWASPVAVNEQLSDALKRAIQLAKKNIESFHSAALEGICKVEVQPGVNCWRKKIPIEKVGLYVPGGTAPLFSTVLMLGVPAQLAGCNEIVLCSPSDHPAISYAAGLCGIRNIHKIGGAQAIGAMAYGTRTVPKVKKIFGPGNSYVTVAKQLVQTEGVSIDMPAGPSELLIIADDSANPAFVAADLLSQAEHGTDSQVILVSTSEKLIEETRKQIAIQVTMLPRKETALISLLHSRIVLVKSLNEAIELSNYYAPEHLILACSDISEKVVNAGSVFIGNYSPEAAGDYASGTNHVLPTGGSAAAYSGISVDSFMKTISFQEISKEGLQHISGTVMQMAEAEGLEAHKKAIEIRLPQP